MFENPSLVQAKELLKSGKFKEAIDIYQSLLAERSDGAAEAAYNLGIVYQVGSGVNVNIAEAEKYYRLADSLGYKMATYRIANLLFKSGNIDEALLFYEKIAESNPSAAYWSYRILNKKNTVNDRAVFVDHYLELAANQGHVLAQRAIAMNFLKGEKGIFKIPLGVKLYINTLVNMTRVVKRDDKLKYT